MLVIAYGIFASLSRIFVGAPWSGVLSVARFDNERVAGDVAALAGDNTANPGGVWPAHQLVKFAAG